VVSHSPAGRPGLCSRAYRAGRVHVGHRPRRTGGPRGRGRAAAAHQQPKPLRGEQPRSSQGTGRRGGRVGGTRPLVRRPVAVRSGGHQWRQPVPAACRHLCGRRWRAGRGPKALGPRRRGRRSGRHRSPPGRPGLLAGADRPAEELGSGLRGGRRAANRTVGRLTGRGLTPAAGRRGRCGRAGSLAGGQGGRARHRPASAA
jgi:hypothetical protein